MTFEDNSKEEIPTPAIVKISTAKRKRKVCPPMKKDITDLNMDKVIKELND